MADLRYGPAAQPQRDHAMHPPTAGLILAGGLSRRMGGGVKGMLPVGGAPMIARIAQILEPQCQVVALNGKGDFGLPQIPDTMPGHLGPLAGVLAGLQWLAVVHPDIDWLLAVPSDAPFLPHDLVDRLHAARLETGAACACAASGGRTHHVVALWHAGQRDALAGALDAGERKVARFLAALRPAIAAWPDRPRDPFFNVNTAADLAAAEAIASGGLASRPERS